MKIILVSALLFFPFLLKAQDQKSLLWKISGNDLKQPSYVFGTIHAICPENFVWTTAMKKAYNESAVICMELPMDDPSMQMKMMQLSQLPAGKRLKDFFTEKEYARLSAFMKDSIQMQVTMFENLKPIFIYSLLLLKSMDCASPIAYERFLLEQDSSRQKKIIGLETVEQQMAIFDSLPVDAIHKMVFSYVDSFAKQKTDFTLMQIAYAAQDLASIHSSITDNPAFLKYENILITKRNINWVPLIEKIITDKPTFIAVGAAHLPGKNGVLQLLKEKGYTIDPVL